MATLSKEKKDAALTAIGENLIQEQAKIEAENAKDVAEARQSGYSPAYINRLTITAKVFSDLIHQIGDIRLEADPVSEIIEERHLENGVLLKKVRVPLGVIGVIYESRPNITIDVAALCIKSGNVAVLKGGSLAIRTNRALVSCIHRALAAHGLPKEAVTFLDTTDREAVLQMVKQNAYIDVIIPRGGYDLARVVVQESTIPVLYHAEGGARIYVDESADVDLAVAVCVNAKTNRPATCNSLDTVVAHKNIAPRFLPRLFEALQPYGVDMRGCAKAREIISINGVEERDYTTEFLDLIMSVKIVESGEEAIAFIMTRSKRHSEGIIAENKEMIARFVKAIDAAAVFVNCSTRLHDGGVFEMGSEMGIATGKLHARGPVGLRELTTYKWVAYGSGQVREKFL